MMGIATINMQFLTTEINSGWHSLIGSLLFCIPSFPVDFCTKQKQEKKKRKERKEEEKEKEEERKERQEEKAEEQAERKDYSI